MRGSSSRIRESRKPTWAADLGCPIVLVGFMGCGKSTVGPLLASMLGVPFRDLDRRIEARGRASIARIFAERGEPAFRALETEELRREMGRRGTRVIAAGGGVLGQPRNHAILSGAVLVWLDAALPVCLERAEGPVRPLLEGGKPFLQQLYRARRALYRRAAMRVRSDSGTAEEVARRIASRLARRFAPHQGACYR